MPAWDDGCRPDLTITSGAKRPAWSRETSVASSVSDARRDTRRSSPPTGRPGDGQSDPHVRSSAGVRGADLAAVGVRDGAHDGHAQAEAAAATGAGAVEGALGFAGREAGPRVGDVQLDVIAPAAGADSDWAVAVAEGVVDEVVDRLFEPGGIRLDGNVGLDVSQDLAVADLAEARGDAL